MNPTPFAVTFDYRCPFARNVHEHLVAGLEAGADWNVEFLPFSLTQTHVEDGGTPVWDAPERAEDLIAIEAGLVVRDQFPERFPDVHIALFAARHDEGRDLRDEAVLRDVLGRHGVDGEEVFAAIADRWPRQAFRKAHESAVDDYQVFGVPTFIAGESAAFVRIMTRPRGDGALARATIEHVLELLVGRAEINEFKHTTISR
ncbi:MAG TPA: DsbA family protein [Acidimicrobiales bacterium]|nr:DsbA family protein [Acidimicrobiales bacterium]